MSLNSTALDALLAAPALEAPSGVTVNFYNPPNKNGLAWFVTTFCMVIATISVCIRAYAKLWLAKKVSAEEILMLGAYGAYWGTAYAAYGMIQSPGYYVHQWNLHNGDLVQPLYYILVYGCAYSATLALVKTAILLDWCHIFVPGDRTKSFFWWGSSVVIFVQLSWGLTCIILLNMQCVPHAAIWKFYLPSKCYTLNKVMLTSASVQVFSDWTMMLLPQMVIWRLMMNWQKKIGVSILFGVGLLACISACFRLATTITFAKEADEMYYIGPLLFWACAEMTCGFFILCVPCITTVIKQIRIPNMFKSLVGSGVATTKNPSIMHSKNQNLSDGPASHTRPRMRKDPYDTYTNLEEEDGGLQLDVLKTSESQEHLRVQHRRDSMKIMCTTQTIVSSDAHSTNSHSDFEDGAPPEYGGKR